MARPGVPKEAVFAAAEDLYEQHQRKPTSNEVRKVVNFGSFSTITTYLNEWWANKQSGQVLNVPEMPSNVSSAVERLWAEAWRASHAAIEAERQALEAQRREMEQQQEEQLAEIKRLEADNETLSQNLEQETKAKTQAEKQLQELKIQNARLEERATSLERERQAAQAEIERLTKITAELDKLKAELQRIEKKQTTKPPARPRAKPKPKTTEK